MFSQAMSREVKTKVKLKSTYNTVLLKNAIHLNVQEKHTQFLPILFPNHHVWVMDLREEAMLLNLITLCLAWKKSSLIIYLYHATQHDLIFNKNIWFDPKPSAGLHN